MMRWWFLLVGLPLVSPTVSPAAQAVQTDQITAPTWIVYEVSAPPEGGRAQVRFDGFGSGTSYGLEYQVVGGDVLGGDSSSVPGAVRSRIDTPVARLETRTVGTQPIHLEGAYDLYGSGVPEVHTTYRLVAAVAGDGSLNGTLTLELDQGWSLLGIHKGDRVFFYTTQDFTGYFGASAATSVGIRSEGIGVVAGANVVEHVEHSLFGRFFIDTGVVQELAQISYTRPGYSSRADWGFWFGGEPGGRYTFSIERALGPRTSVFLIGADIPLAAGE